MSLVADKNVVWRRIASITFLLFLLIGPNFGPIPTLLSQRLSLEGSVVGLLISFLVGFTIILAVIMRMSPEMPLAQLLRSLGLGAPSRTGANIVGLLFGLLWGALLMVNIFQFDPDANLLQFNGFRIVTALMAATGALLEDVITRGFLMNEMRKLEIPNWVQIVVSALIFALYHTAWSGFNIFAMIFSIVYGLILGGLFVWGKRSLTPVILGHSLAVLIAEPFATMLIFLSAAL